jgi:hypothetical protein
MTPQSTDIFAEVYECEGEITLVYLDRYRPAEMGRTYKFCGTLAFRGGKAEVKLADNDSMEAMSLALMPFVHYAAKKLRWRNSYAA